MYIKPELPDFWGFGTAAITLPSSLPLTLPKNIKYSPTQSFFFVLPWRTHWKNKLLGPLYAITSNIQLEPRHRGLQISRGLQRKPEREFCWLIKMQFSCDTASVPAINKHIWKGDTFTSVQLTQGNEQTNYKRPAYTITPASYASSECMQGDMKYL